MRKSRHKQENLHKDLQLCAWRFYDEILTDLREAFPFHVLECRKLVEKSGGFHHFFKMLQMYPNTLEANTSLFRNPKSHELQALNHMIPGSIQQLVGPKAGSQKLLQRIQKKSILWYLPHQVGVSQVPVKSSHPHLQVSSQMEEPRRHGSRNHEEKGCV